MYERDSVLCACAYVRLCAWVWVVHTYTNAYSLYTKHIHSCT